MKLNLSAAGLSRYDSPVLYLTDDEHTVIDVSLPKLSGRFYFVGELGGYHFSKEVTNGCLVFQKAQLTVGEIRGSVVHLYKGIRIREYTVEPLIVTTIDEADIYSDVEKKVNELDERVKTLEKKRIIK